MNNYIIGLIKKKIRPDGRTFLEHRKINITKDPSKYAEGSVIVELGKTKVAVGVKMGIGEPFKDTPNEGILITSAEFVPFASKEFEPGPPSPDAIELARVVDRGIRESKAVDLEKLCIKEGEKVWMVFVDIYVLNHDGNLIDAAGIGAIAALLNAKIPKLDENEEIVHGEYQGELPVVKKPVPVTFYKIADQIIVDPTKEEEDAAEARLTIIFNDDGNIVGMQKELPGYWTVDEIKSCIETGKRLSSKIRSEVLSK